MTVRELIEQLKQEDQSLEVAIEVGGDGAVHYAFNFTVEDRPDNAGSMIWLTSES
jgi:Fe-S cluster assembly iron-binding protein IscA